VNGWSWYWLCWFIFFVPVSFLIPELFELGTGHPENTLSANVWRLEKWMPGQDLGHWTALHVLVGGCLAVLLIWLLGHLVFGLWR
jgi:hypothetical protein